MPTRHLRRALVALALALAFAGRAGAATYYVSSAGANAGAGTTTGAPWLTIAYAVSNSVAGDTILLNGGNTFSEAVSLSSGRTIQSYGTGRATIAGGTSQAVTITNCDGVTLNNLILTMSSTANATAVYQGVVYLSSTDGVRRSAGITVSGCDISGGPNGLTARAPGANTGGWNNVTISGNTIHDCPEFGIYFHEVSSLGGNKHYSSVNITGNTVYNILGDTNGNGASGCGIVLGNVDSTTGTGAGTCYIQSNNVYNCGGPAATQGSGPGGMFPIYADGVVIQKNTVHDIHSTLGGVDGGAYDLDFSTSNCTVQYNYAYNCEGAGLVSYTDTGPNVYRFNVVANCATRKGTDVASLRIQRNSTATILAHNNTIFSTGPNPGAYVYNGGNKSLYNNVFVVRPDQACINVVSAIDATFKLEGNAYQSGFGSTGNFKASYNGTAYTDLPTFRTAIGRETAHGFTVGVPFVAPKPVPLVTDPTTLGSLTAYALLPGSTPRAAGLDINTLYSVNPGTVDFLGNTLGSPYSIGAIDRAGTAPAQTAYQAAVYADGPAFYWRLGEASGTTMYDSAGPGDGTYTGTTLNQTSLLAQDANPSLTTNGTTDLGKWVQLPATSSQTFTNFTVEFWMKPTTVTGTKNLMGWWGASFSLQDILVQQTAAELLFGVHDDTGSSNPFYVPATTNTSLTAGATHHVAWAWTGTNTSAIYVDGVSKTISTAGGNGTVAKANLSTFAIGNYNTSGTGGYPGGIDEVAVYPTALSSARVLAHYNAGVTAQPATGYVLSTSSPTTATGTAETITATLTGGSTLTSTLVVTLADSLSGTIAGTISIPNGSTSASTTDNPSAAGYHQISATHTGGGFTGSDGSVGFTATGSSAATGYTLTASPSPVVGYGPVTITATLTGGTSLGSTLVITPVDTLAGVISGPISIANGSTSGTCTIQVAQGGTHVITATHTGGGFAGSDGSTSFTASAGIYVPTGGLVR